MNAALIRLLPIVALVFSACDSPPSTDAATETASESIPLFKVGKGVLFSDESTKLFGLEIADATDRPIRREIEKPAEVYRAGTHGKPGEALVRCSAEEAKELIFGQRVLLRSANDSGAEFVAKLLRLDRQAEATLGLVEVLIEFADPMQQLSAGALVTASFASGETKSVLAVPATALLSAADGTYVYTVNGTHLTRTHVKAGATADGWIAIEDGLYAGDSVAIKGVDNLWLVELSALKGGTPCCPVPKKETAK